MRKLAFHPLLFAAWPVLSFLAHNVGEVPAREAVRSLFVSVAVALLIFGLLSLALRNTGKAALICSLALLFFFTYGHLYLIMKTWRIDGFFIGRHRFLLPLLLLLLVALSWWVARKLERVPEATSLFNLVGLALVALPIYAIVAYQLAPRTPASVQSNSASGEASFAHQTGALPDIYYIIVDGYGREDVLRELYGFDNSDFIQFLRAQGFFVADNSRTNYAQTLLSLASSMNMQYLDDVTRRLGSGTTDRGVLIDMVFHSKARSLLAREGYKFVAFETGYGGTSIVDADLYLAPHQTVRQPFLTSTLNEFEGAFLETTAVRALLDEQILSENAFFKNAFDPEYQRKRDRILFTLSKLEDIPKMQGQYFVFAHVIAPHPPFVFGKDGEKVAPTGAYSLEDGDTFGGSQEAYILGYRDQATFLNKQLEQTLSRIIARSDPAPIIILQGDHGPGAHLVWEAPDRSPMHERMTILNAYYFPGEGSKLLYPSITPVNSFRALFDGYFGAGYSLLPDESYFSTISRPYDFVRVTDRVLAGK